MNGFKKGRQGFDVSFYQDDDNTPQKIDFTKMVAWGADFVVCRAGQNLWLDEDVKDYWLAAKAAGLPRAAYWFFDPRVDPVKQADLFMGLFVNDKPEGRLWLDLEYPDSWGGAFKYWQDWKKFLEAVKKGGFRTGVYTANWWWSYAAVQKGADLAYFGQYPLWVAQYTSDPSYVTLPRGWSTAVMWQDGTPAIGLEVGVESKEVDHNYWNANFDFAAEWGTAPTPPPTGDTMKYKVIWGIGASRRPEPNTGNTADGFYAYNDEFDVVQDNIPDSVDPTNPGKKWVKTADGFYVASDYPDGTGVSKPRLQKLADPTEPVTKKIVKAVLHYDDGSFDELFPKA